MTLSLPLQKLLDQRPTQRWNERRRLHLLAPPLQALFVRAVAYRDTAAPHLELAIVGDFSAAEELAAQRNSNTKSSPLGSAANALLSPRPSKRQRVVRGSSKKAGSGGGDKGGSGEGRGGPGSGRVDGQEEDGGEREDDAEEEAEEDEALRPHPLQVRVSFRPQKAAADDDARAKPVAGDIEEGEADEGEVEASDGKELQIQFSCLPSLGLIAAQVACPLAHPTLCNAMPHALQLVNCTTVLSCLQESYWLICRAVIPLSPPLIPTFPPRPRFLISHEHFWSISLTTMLAMSCPPAAANPHSSPLLTAARQTLPLLPRSYPLSFRPLPFNGRNASARLSHRGLSRLLRCPRCEHSGKSSMLLHRVWLPARLLLKSSHGCPHSALSHHHPPPLTCHLRRL